MSLDYEALPREFPRRYLPRDVDLSDWARVGAFFAELEQRRIGSVADLEAWLEDYSELLTVMSEASAIRYVRMTEHTSSKEYHDAYLDFVENLEPRMKPAQFRLNRKFAASEFRKLLPADRYGLLGKKIENSIALFREENVDLERQEKKLGQDHMEVTGSMTVPYRGGERTLQEMSKYLEDPDRRTREEAWRLIQGRMAKDGETLDGIFDRMVALRDRIARNAGFANYRDYAFVSRERFDYGPEDCFRFHEAVERQIVPLVREVYRKRRDEMGLDSLRPWDLSVDPLGRPALKPFDSVGELVSGCERVFQKVDPVFSEELRRMSELNLLDLESRPGKAPGGYNNELLEVRLPFIFMNSVGRDQDLRTLLHESGHAFHAFEMRRNALHYMYRSDNTPTEFAEVASMSMELLGGENLTGVFYGPEDAARSKYDHFVSIAGLLPWVCTIDSFQHWIYTNPTHSRAERAEAWVRAYDRFGPGASWEGLDAEKRTLWRRQLHLFQVPFYYIEYGIAQLGALGVWTRYLRDPKGAVATLRDALALGGSKPLPELFARAGLPWDFGTSIVESYGRELRKVLMA
jgi:oligoendopeptidase F